jgi:tripartite ATP-independent transporter DctP family solute receptor
MQKRIRAFALGLALWGATGLSAAAQEAVQIRISTVAPEAELTVQMLRSFATAVEKALPGKVSVKVFPGGSLFRQGTEITAIQRGQLEMATPLFFEIEQQLPEWGVLGAPFTFRDADHLMKVMRGAIGKEYYAEVEKKMQLIALDVGYIGTRQVNLRVVKPVKTPADLAGIKFRVQPGGRTAVSIGKGLGMTPVPMPVTEIYLSLKTGTIDATDSPLPVTHATKVTEIIKQVTMTSHLVQPFVLVIGKHAWDKLAPDQQAVVRKEAMAAMEELYRKTAGEEKSLVAEFEKKGITFVTPDLGAFRAAMMKQLAEDGLTAKWRPGLAEAIAAVK